MKKKIIALMAVMALCIGGLVSCGGDDSSSKGGDAPASAAEQKTDETRDVIATADKLSSDIKWVDELNELESGMIEKVIGVKADLYTKGKVFIGSGGMTAEEIACFEAKDDASAAEIKKALEARVESQKAAFENYQPKEMTKLGDPVLTVSGKYVFMCISDDNAKAKEIIG